MGKPHLVEAASWLEHRFRTLHALRCMNRCVTQFDVTQWPEAWQRRIETRLGEHLDEPRFLELIDCDKLVEETFEGQRHCDIKTAIERLQTIINSTNEEPDAPAHPA